MPWILSWHGLNAVPIMRALLPHTMMKHAQLTAALRALELRNELSLAQHTALHAIIQSANQAANLAANLSPHNLTDPVLAGFCAGDGCWSFQYTGLQYTPDAQRTVVLVCTIAQDKSQLLLEAIQARYGGE